MDKINPANDIQNIKSNLNKAKGLAAESLLSIQDQIEIAEAVTPYWESDHDSHSGGEMYASAVATLHSWAERSNDVAQDFQHSVFKLEISSTAATNTAAITGTLSQIQSGSSSQGEYISRIVTRHLKRDETKKALNKIDSSLGDIYETIWQYMAYPALDPNRGPLFLLRQVFDHFLEKLAPDDEVTNQLWHVPDAELKKRNGIGITRRHRIEYLAKVKVKNPGYQDTVINSSKNFTDVYENLNEAHKRGSLDENAAKKAIAQGEILLQDWLKAIGLLD